MSSSFFEFNIRDPSVWMISLLATLGVSVLYRAVAMMSIGARPRKNKTDLKPNIANTSSNYQKLEKHTQEFNEPKIISVCHDKIHVAIGYGLANAILIEGDTGILNFFAQFISFHEIFFKKYDLKAICLVSAQCLHNLQKVFLTKPFQASQS